MKNSELKEKLNSETMWTEEIEPWITDQFVYLGFKKPKNFMKIRLYDFLNLDSVDSNLAEEMIIGLSRFLYPKRKESAETSPKRTAIVKILIDLMPHPDEMTVGDLLSETAFTEEEMLKVLEIVTQSFYKTDEYDSRYYKFSHLSELKQHNKKIKSEG